ncbi:hypothetical protein [Halostreptopolyspora alba]|uniref:Ig-like domain-containing protein n=1 Tax=Halostreptopolyspora alba TaxID=2487137 RepID=A0A3N0E3V1_9ACTN|nr:hypothetical protein EFW17_18830 [Nocardiopsaceae bacterium YIM 96095]
MLEDMMHDTDRVHLHSVPRLAAVGSAVAVGALALLSASPAQAQQNSTTIEPAGHYLGATQDGAGTFEVDGSEISCDTSESLRGDGDPEEINQIPEAPDNHNSDGPVSGVLSAPVFEDCEVVGVPLTSADITTTPGTWDIEATHGDPSTITLFIPPAGEPGSLTVNVSGLSSCEIEVNPGDEPAALTGTWQGGDPGQLVFDTASVPVEVTESNFGCPDGGEHDGTFDSTYNITNETDPNQPVTITE